jgi:hypothetical protein
VKHQKPEIWPKCQWLLTTGVLLLHDDARSHAAHATVAEIKDLHFECLPHPLYSTDLAPSDFNVFGVPERGTVGSKFRSDEEVQDAVHDWLCKQPKIFFFQEGFRL